MSSDYKEFHNKEGKLVKFETNVDGIKLEHHIKPVELSTKKVLGRYKGTGNLAIDMCAACKDHYRKLGAHVKEIYLQKGYWNDFNRYLLKNIPGHIITDEVDFDGTLIRKASILQIDSMRFVLEGENKQRKFN